MASLKWKPDLFLLQQPLLLTALTFAPGSLLVQAVQNSGSLAKAQRLPLHRRDSGGSGHASAALAIPGLSAGSMERGTLNAGLGNSGSPGAALTSAAVAEAAKEYAKKSGQHLAAGLAAAGSAGYKYFSTQYRHWRSGAQQGTPAQQVRGQRA
jgi:hypothetical protein